MAKRLFCAAFAITLLAGCVSLDYKADHSKPLSDLKVSTNYNGVNMRVRHHGSIECEDPEGKLMAMLNSKTIGLEGGRTEHAQLVAGQQATVSILVALPVEYNMLNVLHPAGREYMASLYNESLKQYYLTFTPLSAHNYHLEFLVLNKTASMKLYDLANGGERVEVEPERFSESCK